MRAHLFRLGSPSALDLDDRIRMAMARGLPLPAERLDQASWTSDNGSVRVWSVSNEGLLSEDLLDVQGGMALGTSGYARGSFRTAAQGLLDGREELDALGGLWSLVAGREGQVIGACSRAGTEPLYYATDAEGAVWIGNRPAWVHLAATGAQQPVIDPVGVIGILCSGCSNSRRTSYEGLTQVGPGGIIEARLDGAAVRVDVRARPRPSRADTADPEALAEALTRAVSDLPLAEGGVINFGLTGGRDSRLVLAALLNAGYEVNTQTHGLETSDDVIVAQRLAAELGVPHRRTTRAGMRETYAGSGRTAVSPELRIYNTIVLGDGMYSAYDATGKHPIDFRPDLASLSGSGGEVLRGGHAAHHEPERGIEGADWLARHLMSQEHIVNPEIWEQYRQSIQHWLDWAEVDPREAMAECHLSQRAGQWVAGSRLGTSLTALPRTVFLDDDVLRVALATPMDALVDESLIGLTMEVLHPGITQIPFLGKRLRFDVEPPKGTPEHDTWVARAPITEGTAKANYNWRLDYAQGIGSFIADSVRLDQSGVFADNAIADLIPAHGKPRSFQGIRGWHAATVGQLSNPRWWDPEQRFVVPTETLEFVLPDPDDDSKAKRARLITPEPVSREGASGEPQFEGPQRPVSTGRRSGPPPPEVEARLPQSTVAQLIRYRVPANAQPAAWRAYREAHALRRNTAPVLSQVSRTAKARVIPTVRRAKRTLRRRLPAPVVRHARAMLRRTRDVLDRQG